MKIKKGMFIVVLFMLGAIAWILAVYAKEYAYRNVVLWQGLALVAIMIWVILFTIGIINVRKRK